MGYDCFKFKPEVILNRLMTWHS